jgi:hypothetical protein
VVFSAGGDGGRRSREFSAQPLRVVCAAPHHEEAREVVLGSVYCVDSRSTDYMSSVASKKPPTAKHPITNPGALVIVITTPASKVNIPKNMVEVRFT